MTSSNWVRSDKEATVRVDRQKDRGAGRAGRDQARGLEAVPEARRTYRLLACSGTDEGRIKAWAGVHGRLWVDLHASRPSGNAVSAPA